MLTSSQRSSDAPVVQVVWVWKLMDDSHWKLLAATGNRAGDIFASSSAFTTALFTPCPVLCHINSLVARIDYEAMHWYTVAQEKKNMKNPWASIPCWSAGWPAGNIWKLRDTQSQGRLTKSSTAFRWWTGWLTSTRPTIQTSADPSERAEWFQLAATSSLWRLHICKNMQEPIWTHQLFCEKENQTRLS